MLTVDEIIARLRKNYEVVSTSLPAELREEFCSTGLPLIDLEGYAPFIRDSVEYEGGAAHGLTMRKIGRKVSVIAFNKKLIAAGVSPEKIYCGLLNGVFQTD